MSCLCMFIKSFLVIIICISQKDNVNTAIPAETFQDISEGYRGYIKILLTVWLDNLSIFTHKGLNNIFTTHPLKEIFKKKYTPVTQIPSTSLVPNIHLHKPLKHFVLLSNKHFCPLLPAQRPPNVSSVNRNRIKKVNKGLKVDITSFCTHESWCIYIENIIYWTLNKNGIRLFGPLCSYMIIMSRVRSL